MTAVGEEPLVEPAPTPRRRRRPRWLRIAVRVTALLVLAVVAVVGGTAVRVWQVARQDHRPVSDAIVVLGSAQYNGTPSSILQARLDHAYALYKQGVAPMIVTVGGKAEGDRYSEAEAGQMYLTEQGVPASAIVVVGEGSDTLQSIRAAAVVFGQRGWHTAVLVTDPWHELRTQRMASDAGLVAVGSPVRSGPVVQTRSTELRYVVRETGAYLYYRMFHRSAEVDTPDA